MQNLNDLKVLEYLKSSSHTMREDLFTRAGQVRQQTMGNQVYLRGLVEFSNLCTCNCYYCGLRQSNYNIPRYHLDQDEIISLALAALMQGYQSICLQSGQVRTTKEINLVIDTVKKIKDISTRHYPEGLGITLSIGELNYQQYKRLFDAGAHRYLLRIETSNPVLFARLHPESQSFTRRIECLGYLREIGYQVGTGVMIGLPEQSIEDLGADLNFFVNMDIDMLGMGPYIPHADTPLAADSHRVLADPYATTLKMIALARILMPDINMVASTALQSIHPQGLKAGLKAGANIVMPVLTPEEQRKKYALYDNKYCKNFFQLKKEIEAAGFEVGLWKWGDSPHWYNRQELTGSSGGDGGTV